MILAESLGQAVSEPPWLDLRALSRFTISSPYLLRPFAGLNRGKPDAEQVKPFSFLLIAHPQPLLRRRGTHRSLRDHSDEVAQDAVVRSAHRQPTTDRDDCVRGGHRRYGDGQDAWRRFGTSTAFTLKRSHSAPAANRAGARPSGFSPAAGAPLYVRCIGNEGNKIEEVEAGLVRQPSEVYTTYDDTWEHVRRILASVSIQEAMRFTELSRRETFLFERQEAGPRGRMLRALSSAWLSRRTLRPSCRCYFAFPPRSGPGRTQVHFFRALSPIPQHR